MATHPLVREHEDFSDIIQKIIAISATKSCGWSQLCRDVPISSNHLLRIRTGKARMGADILLAFLDYIGMLEEFENMIDDELIQLGIKDKVIKRGH